MKRIHYCGSATAEYRTMEMFSGIRLKYSVALEFFDSRLKYLHAYTRVHTVGDCLGKYDFVEKRRKQKRRLAILPGHAGRY